MVELAQHGPFRVGKRRKGSTNHQEILHSPQVIATLGKICLLLLPEPSNKTITCLNKIFWNIKITMVGRLLGPYLWEKMPSWKGSLSTLGNRYMVYPLKTVEKCSNPLLTDLLEEALVILIPAEFTFPNTKAINLAKHLNLKNGFEMLWNVFNMDWKLHPSFKLGLKTSSFPSKVHNNSIQKSPNSPKLLTSHAGKKHHHKVGPY